MKVWNATVENNSVVMTLVSPDGDEGYPGEVRAKVIFQLCDNGELRIEMQATSEKATPINLTNHSYFNLAGHVRIHKFVISNTMITFLYFECDK